MPTTLLPPQADPMAATPESSGFFFHTLRQANASPEPTADSTDSANGTDDSRPGTAPGRTSTAATAATAATANAPGICGRDLEKGEDAAPGDSSAADAHGCADGSSSSTATNCKPSAPASLAPPCCRGLAISSKDERGWRRRVRNFTPSWFSVSMGTGVVSILLHNLPYNAHWVWCLSIAVFGLNIALFVFFSAVTVTRYVLYPEIWNIMIKHPSESLFLGCIPIAFATIVKMMVLVCTPWGNWVIYLAWAFWWVDVVIACASGLVIPFVVVHHHRNQLSSMTAALLLPVIPVVVASGAGALLAGVLPNRGHAVTTLVTSYVLWGLGETFSFFAMTVYFLRLQIHDLPPREVIVSVFLPIGPLGQGGFAIQQLGKVAITLLPQTAAFNGDSIDHSQAALAATAQYGGTVLYILGIVAGFFLWGAALGWLAFAVFSIATTKHFPFNMGWWGFVFPLGVFTSCTSLLAGELSSSFFKVVTMICSACVFCLWILVASKTALMVCRGEMIYAPCLRDLRPKEEAAGENRRM